MWGRKMKKNYRQIFVEFVAYSNDVITGSGEVEQDEEMFWTKFY